jgi:hypothetical protein
MFLYKSPPFAPMAFKKIDLTNMNLIYIMDFQWNIKLKFAPNFKEVFLLK